MADLKNVAALSEVQRKRALRWQVSTDAKGKAVLPAVPELADVVGHRAWLTSVFGLDPAHPIIGGRREGVAGPRGHVVLERAGAGEIEFDPVSRINSPAKLVETLGWHKTPADGPVPVFTSAHCRLIVHVIVMLCGTSTVLSAAQQTDVIVSAFVAESVEVEGFTTYGTGAQRYEAAMALRRVVDPSVGGRPPARYLVDTNTGELVIAVSDLLDAARRSAGSGLPHGWLDARVSMAGWARITLQGNGLRRADGHRPNARVYAYRGLLPGSDDDDA